MAVITDATVTDILEIETTHKAARFTPRPMDHGSLGHYVWSGFTGILPAALAANSEIFQFRWASANVAVIRRVKISASVSTTFFAAGVPVQIDLIRSSSWTVAGTGGTSITPGAEMRKRSTMGNSSLNAGDMRIATTAALGAGTKTLDTYPRATLAAAGPITASTNGLIIPPGTVLFEANPANGDYPMVLAQNEGFSVRSVAVPATGTWTAAISVEWAELASY